MIARVADIRRVLTSISAGELKGEIVTFGVIFICDGGKTGKSFVLRHELICVAFMMGVTQWVTRSADSGDYDNLFASYVATYARARGKVREKFSQVQFSDAFNGSISQSTDEWEALYDEIPCKRRSNED